MSELQMEENPREIYSVCSFTAQMLGGSQEILPVFLGISGPKYLAISTTFLKLLAGIWRESGIQTGYNLANEWDASSASCNITLLHCNLSPTFLF